MAVYLQQALIQISLADSLLKKHSLFSIFVAISTVNKVSYKFYKLGLFESQFSAFGEQASEFCSL